ncbi:MAG: hypothetical protein WDN01_13595 [Rhizomicrobium sp.]
MSMIAQSSPLLSSSARSSNEVSLLRLYVLRAAYLLIAVGLGSEIWPQIFDHPLSMHRATSSLLAGVSAMAVVGLRYPLRMLPLLLFELFWKSTWLIAIALPLWRAGQIDADTMESVKACLMGVVLCPIVIPWPYVFANYVKAAGDRWR